MGAPLPIGEESPFCSAVSGLEVIATPKGAFEVVWAHEDDFTIKGLRFGRNLQPAGAPQDLVQIHGDQFAFHFAGTWAGAYEITANVADFGDFPSDPLVGYRVQVELDGELAEPAIRLKPPRFLALAPAAGGDSLQFRFEPPLFGTQCPSQGLLARRVDASGAPLSAESRVNRRASAMRVFSSLAVDRLPDDSFVAVYSTCHQFTGFVARRLNAAGAPVGKAINLPLPGLPSNISEPGPVLAARGAADFAIAVLIADQGISSANAYSVGVENGRMSGLTRISSSLRVSSMVDLAASPGGGYLLLFKALRGDPPIPVLFAQELDSRGVPRGEPLALSEEGLSGVEGAAAALPDGRWVVVPRAQRESESGECRERLTRTVLASD